MAMAMVVTGDKALDAKLARLAADKTQHKLGRKALGKGLTALAKAQRERAPVGPTGNLKRSIGSRHKKNKTKGVVEAKAGAGVGTKNPKDKTKKVKGRRQAPHAPLVALGTRSRSRQQIGGRFRTRYPLFDRRSTSTGTMTPNEFIKQATASALPTAVTKIKQTLWDEIAKEAKTR